MHHLRARLATTSPSHVASVGRSGQFPRFSPRLDPHSHNRHPHARYRPTTILPFTMLSESTAPIVALAKVAASYSVSLTAVLCYRGVGLGIPVEDLVHNVRHVFCRHGVSRAQQRRRAGCERVRGCRCRAQMAQLRLWQRRLRCRQPAHRYRRQAGDSTIHRVGLRAIVSDRLPMAAHATHAACIHRHRLLRCVRAPLGCSAARHAQILGSLSRRDICTSRPETSLSRLSCSASLGATSRSASRARMSANMSSRSATSLRPYCT